METLVGFIHGAMLFVHQQSSRQAAIQGPPQGKSQAWGQWGGGSGQQDVGDWQSQSNEGGPCRSTLYRRKKRQDKGSNMVTYQRRKAGGNHCRTCGKPVTEHKRYGNFRYCPEKDGDFDEWKKSIDKKK